MTLPEGMKPVSLNILYFERIFTIFQSRQWETMIMTLPEEIKPVSLNI